MADRSAPESDSVAMGIATDWSFQKWRRWVPVGSGILNCLCAGSIILFSLWTPSFQQNLGYNQMQINAISITGELGMYLFVPVFGYICDNHGPDKLSFLTAAFFGPGYFLAYLAYSRALPYQVMAMGFCLVGMGSSSMYFSGVTMCVKNLTEYRGLALSLPITAFGLSPLWLSQFVSRVFVDAEGVLRVGAVFVFFAVFVSAVAILDGLALGVFPTEEGGEGEGERERLLGGETECPGGMAEEGDKKRLINAATREFLSDKTMWLFAAGLFLATGPGEAFINNMGSLIQTLYPPSPTPPPVDSATNISIIAITSTLSRILSGLLSDYLAPSSTPSSSRRFTISRIPLLLCSAALLLTANLLLTLGFTDLHPDRFPIISALVGSGYGAVFTLAPTVVSVVWGTGNFGTNWGIVTMTPAVGAVVFGILYAKGYERYAGDDGRCWGWECYGGWAAAATVGTGAAVVGWWVAGKVWRGRGMVV